MIEHFLLFSGIVVPISCIVVSVVLLIQIKKMVGQSTSTYEELKRVVDSSSIVRGSERERELYKMRMHTLNEVMDLVSEKITALKREESPTLVSTQLRNKTYNEIIYTVSQRIAELREGEKSD